jgi:hypothetical protein
VLVQMPEPEARSRYWNGLKLPGEALSLRQVLCCTDEEERFRTIKGEEEYAGHKHRIGNWRTLWQKSAASGPTSCWLQVTGQAFKKWFCGIASH